MSRILALDVETAPALAYTFQLRDTTIGVEQIVEPGRIICWAAQWYGERVMHFADERGGAKEMFQAIWSLMADADAILSYNGVRFDEPKLRGAFIQHDLPPLPPA